MKSSPKERPRPSTTTNYFNDLRAQEHILGFVCEWHPGTGPNGFFFYQDFDWVRNVGLPMLRGTQMNQTYSSNVGGHFMYIERLAIPPNEW